MKTVKFFIAFLASGILMPQLQAQNTFPATGNVGIGTSNPNVSLDIDAGVGNAFIRLKGTGPGVIFSHSSSPTAYIGLSTSSAFDHYITGSLPGDLNLRSTGSGRIRFGTGGGVNANMVMEINSAGTVHIPEVLNVGGQASFGDDVSFSDQVSIGGVNPYPNTKLYVEGVVQATQAIKNNCVKLADNQGYVKLRRYNNGEDLVFKTALAPSHPSIAELLVNFNGQFANGTRIMGPKLIVDGQVAIGTDDTRGYGLAVNGGVLTTQVKIRTFANWPDYVFEAGYDLKKLADLEADLEELGHLPGMPSAAEVAENGFDVGEVNAKLLEKVEELTLYTIQQQKEIEELREMVETLVNEK